MVVMAQQHSLRLLRLSGSHHIQRAVSSEYRPRCFEDERCVRLTFEKSKYTTSGRPGQLVNRSYPISAGRKKLDRSWPTSLIQAYGARKH